MFLAHYLLPLGLYYYFRDKIMLWGLLLGNIIDLDHLYLRLKGDVGWFESACARFGENCSIGVYPLHSWTLAYVGLVMGSLIFCKDNRFRFFGWFGIGLFLAVALDWIHEITGVFI